MTKDILQSDLDVAMRLIKTSSDDSEIVAALKLRGVALTKAAQLVHDLRAGRLVTPVVPVRSTLRSNPATGTTDTGMRPPGPEPSLEPDRRTTRPANGAPKTKYRKTRAGFGARAVVAFCLAASACAAAWVWTTGIYRRSTAAKNDTEIRAFASEGSTKIMNGSAAAALLPSSSIVLELQPDGLHLAGSIITCGNALRAISAAFGPPTRTNRIEQANKVVYAYDRHGILIYSGKGSGDDAIVLDYDGVGGTNGTTLPFAGTLKCEEQLIQADTSSSRLTSMKQLGLSNRGTEEGTFQARCYNLDLVFAYLNGPARLSLIEINLTGR